MSIYNAIANSGQNAGAPISNYFANKYQVDRDKMLDQEAQQQNAYVKQRDTMQIKQQALGEAARIAGAGDIEAAFGYLDQVSDQIGEARPNRAQLAPILQGMAKTAQANGIVGSPLRLGSGNYGYMNESGQIVDTGSQFAPEVIQMGGGGLAMFSPGMQAPQTVIPPEAATGRDAGRAAAITAAQENAQIAAIPERADAELGATVKAGQSEREQKAGSDLPGILAKAQQSLSVIKQLRDHPGVDYLVGPAAIVPIVPGTPQADAAAFMDQIQGQAFLQAFESLKGGGQITQIEGEKATNAIARLSRRQTKEAFKGALNELIGIVESGVKRAEKAAGKKDAPVDVEGVKTMESVKWGDLPDGR